MSEHWEEQLDKLEASKNVEIAALLREIAMLKTRIVELELQVERDEISGRERDQMG